MYIVLIYIYLCIYVYIKFINVYIYGNGRIEMSVSDKGYLWKMCDIGTIFSLRTKGMDILTQDLDVA